MTKRLIFADLLRPTRVAGSNPPMLEDRRKSAAICGIL
jgi:hypothetical protein